MTLEKGIKLQTCSLAPGYKSHGEAVVEDMIAKDAKIMCQPDYDGLLHPTIDTFVKRWRKHFVDECSPKFMPEGWDIGKKSEAAQRSVHNCFPGYFSYLD